MFESVAYTTEHQTKFAGADQSRVSAQACTEILRQVCHISLLYNTYIAPAW